MPFSSKPAWCWALTASWIEIASLSSCCGIEPVTAGFSVVEYASIRPFSWPPVRPAAVVGVVRVAGVERRARRHRRGQSRRGARIDDEDAAERHGHDAVLAGGDLRVAETRHLVEQVVALVEQVVRVLPDGLELRDRGVEARDLLGVRVDLRDHRVRLRVDVGALRGERGRGRLERLAERLRRLRERLSRAGVLGRRRDVLPGRPEARHRCLQAGRARLGQRRLDALPGRLPDVGLTLRGEGRAQVVVVELVADPRHVRDLYALAELARGDHAPHRRAPRARAWPRAPTPVASTRRCSRSRCCGSSCRATPARPAGRSARC